VTPNRRLLAVYTPLCTASRRTLAPTLAASVRRGSRDYADAPSAGSVPIAWNMPS
jgi:hypothetical protein